MKIRELRLKNFRKFEDSVFKFNTDTNVSVLIGDNATGKSAILDALSIMMGSYLLDFKAGVGRHIRKEEVRLKQINLGDTVTLEPQWDEGVSLSCRASLTELASSNDSSLLEDLRWTRELKSEKGKTTRILAKNIAKVGKDARARMEKGEEVLLPVFGYYGTGRLWHIKHVVKLTKPESRSAGYRDCLDPASSHKLFLRWFAQLEQASFQKGKKFGVLEAVRKSIQYCIPECRYFYFDIELQQLMIELENGQLFSFDNLSDGYRNTLAIVADIAHRAGRLNPHLMDRAPLETPGIVLIDEVDLHLHPKWQRRVLNDLREAFPKVQFIVTTHSPFIIQSLRPGEVIDLNSVLPTDESSETASPAPTEPFSDQSVEDIVERVMGVEVPSRSQRWQAMNDTAKKYYTLLQQANGASKEEKEQLKQELDELSAPFSDNVAYHAFLEMERAAAGLSKGKAVEE
ncbi:AAA family ATPase [Endozoicomonas sp. ALC020]|uniref:AAA family ATPase n=1 Tax=unclassified Endozoicomonas TaxID=2644528 RepID=UPI003BAF1317